MSSRSVDPRTGQPFGPHIADTRAEQLEFILASAEGVAAPWSASSDTKRARCLAAIADGLEAARDILVSLADQETALGEERLNGELSRCTFQIAAFADLIRDGVYRELAHDPADLRAPPQGHADLRTVRVPVGRVAVFGASNFPFAFGVIGGDTSAALAAGCPVVTKAHPAHPQLSERLITLAASVLRGASQRRRRSASRSSSPERCTGVPFPGGTAADCTRHSEQHGPCHDPSPIGVAVGPSGARVLWERSWEGLSHIPSTTARWPGSNDHRVVKSSGLVDVAPNARFSASTARKRAVPDRCRSCASNRARSGHPRGSTYREASSQTCVCVKIAAAARKPLSPDLFAQPRSRAFASLAPMKRTVT